MPTGAETGSSSRTGGYSSRSSTRARSTARRWRNRRATGPRTREDRAPGGRLGVAHGRLRHRGRGRGSRRESRARVSGEGWDGVVHAAAFQPLPVRRRPLAVSRYASARSGWTPSSSASVRAPAQLAGRPADGDDLTGRHQGRRRVVIAMQDTGVEPAPSATRPSGVGARPLLRSVQRADAGRWPGLVLRPRDPHATERSRGPRPCFRAGRCGGCLRAVSAVSAVTRWRGLPATSWPGVAPAHCRPAP